MKILLTLYFIVLLFGHSLFAQKEDWTTFFEKSNFLRTPRYIETMEYFSRFEKNSPYAKFISFGVSPQGRDLKCLIVSKDKTFTPTAAKKTGKPIVLILNGIHSGEIEGKDACMLLLRDILITKEKKSLLDNAILLVVPIFSVDGHERFSKYNRINQDGPDSMGWRTTAQNLNLNRDWMKADAPEMLAMLKFFSTWIPDYFIDNHTSDGADHQYTVTYGLDKFDNLYRRTANVVTDELIPYLVNRVEEQGFSIAPYVGFKGGDPEKGLVDWPSTPRFSNGYATVQNRIGLLVETHVLKPYKDRVFGTKAILLAALEWVNANAKKLLELNKESDRQTIVQLTNDHKFFPIAFKITDDTSTFLYKGIESIVESSYVSGGRKTVYTGKPYTKEIPYYNKAKIIDSVQVPALYLIPGEWKELVERMKYHGIVVDSLKVDKQMEVTRYKFKDIVFNQSPYEGRFPVTVKYDSYKENVMIPAGTYVVRTDQRTIRIIIHLMEPKSGDSFLRWGFMNAIFEQKEYYEDYIMEKVAIDMLNENPDLKKEFETKLASDEKFRKDPDKRLQFFYERSPYWDNKLNVYPIMRVETISE